MRQCYASVAGVNPLPSPTDRRIEIVRAQLDSGQLPLARLRQAWYGDGTGVPCDGCGDVIEATDIQVQAICAGTITLRLHSPCFKCWRDAVEQASDS